MSRAIGSGTTRFHGNVKIRSTFDSNNNYLNKLGCPKNVAPYQSIDHSTVEIVDIYLFASVKTKLLIFTWFWDNNTDVVVAEFCSKHQNFIFPYHGGRRVRPSHSLPSPPWCVGDDRRVTAD